MGGKCKEEMWRASTEEDRREEILHGKINAELEFWFNMQVQRKPALKIPSDYNRMQDATRVCVWGGRGGIHNA